MKKHQARQKLVFNKKWVTNLNASTASRVLGGGDTQANPISVGEICENREKSISSGCFTCDCDSSEGNN